ncbi:MAG: chromate transporter, partial [Treponema sp.]|nr:chromate transporter [Treponema sp.]
LFKGVFKDLKAIVIFGIAFCLSAIWSASPVLLVAAAGVAGFLLNRPKEPKAPQGGGEKL